MLHFMCYDTKTQQYPPYYSSLVQFILFAKISLMFFKCNYSNICFSIFTFEVTVCMYILQTCYHIPEKVNMKEY